MSQTFQDWVMASGGNRWLARKLGYSIHAIRIWVNRKGCPKVSTLVRLSEMSGLSLDKIIEDTRARKRGR